MIALGLLLLLCKYWVKSLCTTVLPNKNGTRLAFIWPFLFSIHGNFCANLQLNKGTGEDMYMFNNGNGRRLELVRVIKMENMCKSKYNIAKHKLSLPMKTAARAFRAERQEQVSPSGKGGQVFLVEVILNHFLES